MLNKIYAEWLLLLRPVKFCGGLLWFWCFPFWRACRGASTYHQVHQRHSEHPILQHHSLRQSFGTPCPCIFHCCRINKSACTLLLPHCPLLGPALHHTAQTPLRVPVLRLDFISCDFLSYCSAHDSICT